MADEKNIEDRDHYLDHPAHVEFKVSLSSPLSPFKPPDSSCASRPTPAVIQHPMRSTDNRIEHQNLTSSMLVSWISRLENGKSSHQI
jgi:hypothetical protein